MTKSSGTASAKGASKRHRVDVAEVKRLLARLGKINAIPFDKIEWTERGKPLPIPEEVKQEWRFIGMSNCSFIELDLHRAKWRKQPA